LGQWRVYQLAKNPDWQVILTTHSPYFINPFEDHTTIVRLDRERDDDQSPVTPRTYRSDLIEFEGDNKQRLQALQHIDPSFSEVFFGSHPVLVEGDTEHAAFMASINRAQSCTDGSGRNHSCSGKSHTGTADKSAYTFQN
jgi:predicted ATP-dependent endonuclease of OLD family